MVNAYASANGSTFTLWFVTRWYGAAAHADAKQEPGKHGFPGSAGSGNAGGNAAPVRKLNRVTP
jgi:hypothetical protein